MKADDLRDVDRYLYLRARSYGALYHAKPAPEPRFYRGLRWGVVLAAPLWLALGIGFWLLLDAVEGVFR